MSKCLIWLLISVIIVEGSKENCEESRQLESSCSSYCYKAVRPILDHTKTLQDKIDKDENREKSNIESFLNEKFHVLQNTIQKEIQSLKIPLNTQPFRRIGWKYYYIDNLQTMNWFAAVNKCHELGGHLVSLHSQDELEALILEFKQRFYWIDVNDLAKEGDYYSMTTGLRAPFLKWYTPDEPNNMNKNEHCVQLRELNGVYSMNDVRCDDNCYIICEKEFI